MGGLSFGVRKPCLRLSCGRVFRAFRSLVLFSCLSCFSWFLLLSPGGGGHVAAQAPTRFVVFEGFLNAG